MFSFSIGSDPFKHFLLMLCLGSGFAFAEEPLELDDLLVTASMEAVSSRIVASSVTVITREEIEQRQVKYLADLLRDVPGFAVSQAGGVGTQTQIRVRGAESNQLLVLMDGIRANDPASNDEFQFQYQLTSNIERIEIIRGPQSAIWGTDALSGVINIIRRKDVSNRYLHARAEYGSFDSINLGVDGGMAQGRYQLSGGVAFQDSDGTNTAREGDEKDGARSALANVALDVEATEALTLSFSAQHVDATSDFDDVDFFVTGLPMDADRVTEAERWYLRSEARFEPPGGRWNGGIALNWLDTGNENFYDGAWESSTAADSLELRLRTSFRIDDSGRQRITFALDRDEVDFRQRGTATPFGDPNQDQGFEVTGYAGEYAAQLSDRSSMTASARQDDFSDFDDAFTWQLGASHRLSESLKLRGSVGTGSKAPTFIERFGYFSGSFIGNPDLKPEQSRGWELGIDKGFGDDRWRLGLAYFDQELKDEIDGFVFDPNTFLFTAKNREGKSHRNGVEVVLDGEVTEALSLAASYTYVDATEGDAQGDEIREVRRPRNMASLTANFEFADDRGLLNMNLNYNGTQLDSFFPPPFYAEERVTLDDYLVAGVAASWKVNDSLELVARVSNLFDKDYEEVLGFARPGRAFYAGLRGWLGQ